MSKLHTDLRVTKNYNEFINDERNRDVQNVRKLTESMRKYGFIPAYPLHVVKNNGKKVIKDGGHRFHVARMLELPIYYVICPEDQDVSIAEINNTQRSWTMRDYVASFVRTGHADYLELQQFQDEYGLPIMACASLLYGQQSSSMNANKAVKTGTFRVKDREYASKVASIVLGIRSVTKGIARNAYFLSALSKCCLVEGFDIDRFVRHANRLPGVFQSYATVDDFLKLCETVYNDRVQQQNKVPLAFLAKNANERRSFGIHKTA